MMTIRSLGDRTWPKRRLDLVVDATRSYPVSHLLTWRRWMPDFRDSRIVLQPSGRENKTRVMRFLFFLPDSIGLIHPPLDPTAFLVDRDQPCCVLVLLGKVAGAGIRVGR
jgi:hypothetical protein